MSVPLPLSPTSASMRAAAAETTSLITRREEEDDDGEPIKQKGKGRECDVCGWLRKYFFAPPMIKLMDIPLTKTQRIRFEDVRRRASVLYDPEQDEHVRSLYALGIAVFGESFAASDIKSDKWKLIGFQGSDPASDFRASGLFGLQNLAYFVHTQPRAFRRICGFTDERRDSNASTSSSTSTSTSTPHVATVSDPEHYLPCALSGINITFMLTNLLSVRRSLREPMLPEAAQHFQAFVRLLECEMYAFEELYCECFLLLEELWHIHHARYTDFNNILARVREYVVAALERNPINMRDFHRIMSQISQS